MAWQPIDTAPKTEDPKILWFDKSEYGDCVIEGWWFSSPKEIDDGWETVVGFIGEPTYWMPLTVPQQD